MSVINERRLLVAMLRRLDGEGNSWLASRWAAPASWLALAACFFLLMKFIGVVGAPVAICAAALAGHLACLVRDRIDRVRAWRYIAPHIDKPGVEARLAELDR